MLPYLGGSDVYRVCYAIKAIEEEILKVPDDIAVVGFTDIKTTLPRISLTTLRQPKCDIGTEAICILLKLIETGRKKD